MGICRLSHGSDHCAIAYLSLIMVWLMIDQPGKVYHVKPLHPKFYPGKARRPPIPALSPSRRRNSLELPTPTFEIPGVSTNLGGARLLSPAAQASLYFNYPPMNANRLLQGTPSSVPLPPNTTFCSGYNFDRAKMHHRQEKGHFRPTPLQGETP